MAQTTFTATTTWTQIAIGAFEVLIQNLGPYAVRISKKTSPPTVDNEGIIVWPQGHVRRGQSEYNIQSMGSDNLYARAVTKTATIEITT